MAIIHEKLVNEDFSEITQEDFFAEMRKYGHDKVLRDNPHLASMIDDLLSLYNGCVKAYHDYRLDYD